MAALRRRLETGAEGSHVLLTEVGDAEREAVARLLGRAPANGRSLRVRVDQIEQLLRHAGIAPDLEAALVTLGGALHYRRAEREAADRAWEQLFEEAARKAPARLSGWVEGLARSGLLKRLCGSQPDQAARLMADCFTLAEALPARGLTLSTLAARVTGDAHALDRGRPLGTLTRSMVAHLSCALEEGENGEGRDEGERALWATVGILVGGDITSTALLLNLPALSDTATGRIIQLWHEAGEPGYLTLRQLLRDPPHWQCDRRDIFICENPAVVAEAAERLGARAAPLVCTQGRPRAAVIALLDQLATAGALFHYHGDFDWPGIAIANAIFHRYHARPWHYDAAALDAAVDRPGGPLEGRAVEALWDPNLTHALARRGRALHEEQHLPLLLADLAEEGDRSVVEIVGIPST